MCFGNEQFPAAVVWKDELDKVNQRQCWCVILREWSVPYLDIFHIWKRYSNLQKKSETRFSVLLQLNCCAVLRAKTKLLLGMTHPVPGSRSEGTIEKAGLRQARSAKRGARERKRPGRRPTAFSIVPMTESL